ncbi:MAG: hypothetical protein LBJ61_11620 [Deltaproteobacteria bacterium]|jgi:hypothetical protein|nr:hypothetical protein [Deltaproteobacteria bacterium]
MSVTILAFGGLALAQDEAPPAPGGPPPVDYDNGYSDQDGNIDQSAPPQNWDNGRGYGRGYGRGHGHWYHGDWQDYRDDDYGPGYGDRRRGHRNWRGGPKLSEEQKTALEKLQTDHWAKVEPLLDQLRDNQLLYQALENNQNASVDEIKKVISELSRVRKELRAEALAFRQSLKDKGFSAYARGGPGWDGPGRGIHGWGGHGGGFGVCPILDWNDGPDDDFNDYDYGRRGHWGKRHWM